MQEALNHGIAVLLAGLAYSALHDDGRKRSPWPFVMAVAIVSLIRFTWLLLLIPWVGVVFGRTSRRMWSLLALTIVVVIPALFLLTRWLSAPYPNFASRLFVTARLSPHEALMELFSRSGNALKRFLSPGTGESLEILQHFELVGLCVASAGFAVFATAGRRIFAFAALNLALIAALMITLYDIEDWRDYRVIAPHLLLSLLLLASAADYRLPLGVAVLHLFFLYPFLDLFEKSNRDRLVIKPPIIAEVRSTLSQHLAYQAEEPPWNNTVLVSVRAHEYLMLALPPGIGISYVMEGLDVDSLHYPLKSRYLLMWPPHVRRLFGDKTHLKPLVTTPMGTLYLNLDSLPEGPERANTRERD
jgi:hypothetical protein